MISVPDAEVHSQLDQFDTTENDHTAILSQDDYSDNTDISDANTSFTND